MAKEVGSKPPTEICLPNRRLMKKVNDIQIDGIHAQILLYRDIHTRQQMQFGQHKRPQIEIASEHPSVRVKLSTHAIKGVKLLFARQAHTRFDPHPQGIRHLGNAQHHQG